jgi:predicted N-acetyltransferase YhbS
MLEVRAATTADLDSAADCIAAAFRGADRTHAQVRDEVLKSVRTDPFASLGDLRVGILGGEVVSAVAVLPRPIYMGGAVLSMGGIAAVCTRESHRGNGYNTAVLRDALAYVEGEGHDISLLYTGIHGYYERLGWRAFGHGVGHDITAPSELRRTGFHGSVRPMRPVDDLPSVRAIYEASNRDQAGPVARNAAYWDYHTDRLRAYHVAVEDGSVVAYLHDSGNRRIEETGSIPGRETAEVALVADVLARGDRSGGAVYLGGSLHLVDSLRRIGCNVERLGTGPQEPPGPTMYRIMRLGPLVEKLLPAMTERLAASPAAGRAGVVRVQSEVGAVDIQYGPAGVTRGDGAGTPSITLDASHTQTIELVFGQIDAVSLVTPGGEAREPVGDILAALFPRLTYQYPSPDAF